MSSTIQHEKHLKELEQLIRDSCLAIEELDKTIEEFPKIMESSGEGVFEDLKRNKDLSWHHINGLLIYAARISRILWGKNGYKKTRGEYLRGVLNISESSIFHYQNRDVRDDFDHIDERIDDFERGDLKGRVDRNIAPVNDWIGNMGVGDYARHYDPQTRIIYFGLHSLSIVELLQELKHLEREVANQLS